MTAAPLVGLAWFTSSALFSTWANTAFLLFFKDPLMHTFIRFLGSAAIGLLTLLSTKDVVISEIPKLVSAVFVPGILLWLANYMNSISLQLTGITLTYVVKACIPVFTVLTCSVLGQKFPTLIYISLIPICLGVILASGSDLDVSMAGFGAALASALAQTFMNIAIKTVRERTGYSGQKSFLGMTIVATLATIPIVFAGALNTSEPTENLTTYRRMLELKSSLSSGDQWPVFLTLLAALAYHIEYLLNFVFVGFVSPVTFSVCDIARRVAIISTGAFVFSKVLTMQNWVGIVIALAGVLWYSYLENQYKQSGMAEKSKRI